MTGRATMLPAVLVIVIIFLVLITISSGRSDAPDVVGDRDYPFYICTFDDYCEGATCTKDESSFVAYLSHANGEPRLEIPRVNPNASLTRDENELVFDTQAGEVRGTLTVYRNRAFDWVGFSGVASNPVEHYGSGQCERLKTP